MEIDYCSHYAGKMWGFTLKTYPMLSLHTTTISGHFGFVRGRLGQRIGNHVIIVTSSFSESSLSSMFSVHTKAKSWRFQIPPVWKAFSQNSFSWRISVDGRPNRESKATFQIPLAQSACYLSNQLPYGLSFFAIPRYCLLSCIALFANCIQSHLHSVLIRLEHYGCRNKGKYINSLAEKWYCLLTR